MTKPSLDAWFSTEQGDYVGRWLLSRHERLVADLFGFNAVQIGLPQFDLLAANRMPFKFHCSPAGQVSTRAEVDALPFATASVDLVVLPYVLDFASQPHQVLREVERILVPEGSVLVTGFNPFSLWGMRRRLGLLGGASVMAPWHGHYISVPRLKDWFSLLGFETRSGSFGCYAPPCQQQKWLERWAFMEDAGDRWWPYAGGTYILQGIKRVHGMRLIKPSWKHKRAHEKGLLPVAQRGLKRVADSQVEMDGLKTDQLKN